MNAPSQRARLIYIIAAKQDAEWRDPIHAELEAQAGSEFSVWSRRLSLPPGSEWDTEMRQAREQAAIAVVVLSTHSVNSEFVRQEIEDLQQLRVPLFPIVAEECEWQEFAGVGRITIFDEARPLNSYPAETQREKIKEFARAVLTAVRDQDPALRQKPKQSRRDDTSEQRQGALTRGEMSSEQQEVEDEARFREWRLMLPRIKTAAHGLRERRDSGTLGQEDLFKVIEAATELREQIENWFQSEDEVPEEGHSIILTLREYEAEFRQMLVTLLGETTTATPASTDAEGAEATQQKAADASLDTTALGINVFSSGSRRVLGWADVFREKRGEKRVDIVHLIAALQQSDDGVVRDAFTKAGIDWPGLRLILQGNQWHIPVAPEEIRAESSEATALPALSDDSRAALAQAVALAQSENSAVQPHHLFIAVFSIDLPITRALQERGVRLGVVPPRRRGKTRRIGAPRGRTNAGQDIAGVSSDVAKGVDLLDIEAEVAALCSVIAARDVQPPLSIGLFGDWGTGKSFFMEKMWERIEQLEKEGAAENSLFASHIVQLKFNAWYYIDTNLWATLGSEIFRGLADALAADDTQPAQARERLLAAASSQRDVLAEAERRASAASEQLHQNEERLIRLASDEADIDSRLSKPSKILHAAYRVAVQDPNVQAQVHEAAKTLNLSNVEAAATETKAQLMELRGLVGLARATWLAVRRHKRLTMVWALASLLILAILYVITATTWWSKEIGLDVAIARVAAFITAVAATLAPLATKARKALAFIHNAQEQSRQVVDAERKKEKEALQARKQKIQNETASLQKRVDEASAALAKFEQQLAELRADRQMSNFIKTRNESRDYTSHLGVIARARDDFQRLSNLLEEVRKQTEEERNGQPPEEKLLLPRIDRIILYIDDLDRCPEDKVVDVLQAVHLLLAFPLFVVVVGVDSRWLLHSLKQHSRAFQPEKNGDEGELNEEGLHWQSTPLNYLEKIFQIPFSLRPMQPDGFGDLIEQLTEPKYFSREKKQPASLSASERQVKPEQTDLFAAAKTSGAGIAQESPPQGPVAQEPAQGVAPNTAPLPRQNGGQTVADRKAPFFKPLNLSDDEREFMKRLHPLIPTPRAAKRFVNVYRLLRALNDEDEAFRGSKERAEHRAVLVLLAILTGHPSQGTEFLRDLLEGKASDRSWWDFVDDYRSRAELPSNGAASQADAERWRQFFEKIDEVRNDLRNQGSCLDFDESSDAFVKWAGQVSRFSFQSARVVLQRNSEDLASPREPVTAAS